MELRDWIALFQAVGLAAVGMFFAIRLEKLRKTFSRSLKRYDLLHTARFKILEDADDRLVDVQLVEFESWKLLQNRAYANPNADLIRDINESISKLRKVVQAVAVSKIKCEKLFDAGFNSEFAELVGKIQTSEMYIRDVANLRYLSNIAQVENETVGKMNEACRISKAAIPAFRKRMGEIIQKDLSE